MEIIMRKSIFILISITIAASLFGCIDKDDNLNVPEDEICKEGTLKAGRAKGHCGCDTEDVINMLTGRYTCDETDPNDQERVDLCPNDPDKIEPGICGCGLSDAPNDKGEIWCSSLDLCPLDEQKVRPGVCGCGVSDEINPQTGLYICLENNVDLCPENPDKKTPGICGCDESDDVYDPELAGTLFESVPICLTRDLDMCPHDANKTRPGKCGCGVSDVDTDGDGYLDCVDACPNDKNKWEDEGVCGCGLVDSDVNLSDDDGDGVPNCIDICPNNVYKSFNTKNVPHTNGKYSEDVEKCVLEDGTPDCARIYTVYETKPLCALIIDTPEALIELRDAWNNGEYEHVTPERASFILKEDIDIGDNIPMLEDWFGIGTETYPFFGIFLGEKHKVSATTGGTSLVLGSSETDAVGLFSVIRGGETPAVIDNLQVDLSFTGHDHVGILAGKAENVSIKHISVTGSVSGESNIGGLVGFVSRGMLENVSANATVSGNVNAIGGLIGMLSGSGVSHAFVSGNSVNISSRELATETGGFVGVMADASSISNAYSSGNVSGYAYTGGFVGAIKGASTLINAYAFASVTCQSSPCAGMVATIMEESTLNNVYATNYVVNSIVEDTSGSTEGEPDGGGADGNNEGSEPSSDDPTPGEGNGSDDGGHPQTEPTDICDTEPITGLIAEVCGENTIVNFYAWTDAYEVSVPESLHDKLQKFSFKNLIATLENGSYLKTQLNKNINCDSKGICILDDVTYEPWNQIQFRLNNMSLSIPAFTSLKTTY